MRLTKLNQLVRGPEDTDGRWELTDRHELQFRRSGQEEEIILKGALVEARSRGLVFRVQEQSQADNLVSRRLTLRGRWQATPKNKLAFVIDGRPRPNDWLVLQGSWELNGRHELLYRFRAERLKTKTKQSTTLRFKGRWQITDARHLTYQLERTSDSSFRFRGTFQTPTLQPKGGAVRFQLGMELKGKQRLQTVTLFGKWRFSRKLGLALELPRGPVSQPHRIDFQADYQVSRQGKLTARLKTVSGKPLGMELIFTRTFLQQNGEAFARVRRQAEETAIEAGLRFRW